MAKTTQVMKLACCGKKYTVQFIHGTTHNPFRVYEHTSGWETDGRFHEHKRLVAKFQDFMSVLYFLTEDHAFYKEVL